MTSDTQALLSELNRVKVLFQARAIAAVLGIPQTVNDLRNDQSEPLGIGGGADFFQHPQLATDREPQHHG